jgi:sialate O-acetylesterase
VTDNGGGGGIHGQATDLRLDTAAGAVSPGRRLAGAASSKIKAPAGPSANDAPALGPATA